MEDIYAAREIVAGRTISQRLFESQHAATYHVEDRLNIKQLTLQDLGMPKLTIEQQKWRKMDENMSQIDGPESDESLCGIIEAFPLYGEIHTGFIVERYFVQ